MKVNVFDNSLKSYCCTVSFCSCLPWVCPWCSLEQYVLYCHFKNQNYWTAQHSFKLCLPNVLPSLIHFKRAKIFELSFEVGGICHQNGSMTSPSNFKWTGLFFLLFKNGLNFQKSLLSIICIYSELFSNFNFKNNTLVHMYTCRESLFNL